MKLKSTNIVTNLNDEDITGLTLSLFRALMKANKANNASAVNFFMRERLSQKSHRRALNAVLNALSNNIASSNKLKSQINQPMLEAIKPQPHASESELALLILSSISTVEAFKVFIATLKSQEWYLSMSDEDKRSFLERAANAKIGITR